MRKRIVAICTKCGNVVPIASGNLWVFVNVELREAMCANIGCDCKTFRMEEVPSEELNEMRKYKKTWKGVSRVSRTNLPDIKVI